VRSTRKGKKGGESPSRRNNPYPNAGEKRKVRFEVQTKKKKAEALKGEEKKRGKGKKGDNPQHFFRKPDGRKEKDHVPLFRMWPRFLPTGRKGNLKKKRGEEKKRKKGEGEKRKGKRGGMVLVVLQQSTQGKKKGWGGPSWSSSA